MASDFASTTMSGSKTTSDKSHTIKNLLAGLIMLVLTGCATEQASQPQVPTYDPNTQVVLNKFEYGRLQKTGRFQPFKGLTSVALDTTTGQVCRTSDWHRTLPLCPKHGTPTEPCKVAAVGPDDEDAPLCSSLLSPVPSFAEWKASLGEKQLSNGTHSQQTRNSQGLTSEPGEPLKRTWFFFCLYRQGNAKAAPP